MKKSFVILALVAGCGASDHESANRTAAGRQERGSLSSQASAPAVRQSAGGGSLAGLYQGGNPSQPNQLCIADKGDAHAFGLTVWGGNMAVCSGAGLARREGDTLTLTMTGDSACTISAAMAGGKLTLPAHLPEGCAYYCGKGAHLTGADFILRETGAAGAAKAKDPAGDPLCSG